MAPRGRPRGRGRPRAESQPSQEEQADNPVGAARVNPPVAAEVNLTEAAGANPAVVGSANPTVEGGVAAVFAQLLTFLQANEQLRAAEQAAPPPAIPAEQKRLSYEEFKGLNPLEFTCSYEPIEANNWIRETERIFEIFHCREEDKVIFVTMTLKDEARNWWDVVRAVKEDKLGAGARVGWTRFIELFREQYFPVPMSDQLEMEFLGLKQKEKTVAQYAANFNILARYAPR